MVICGGFCPEQSADITRRSEHVGKFGYARDEKIEDAMSLIHSLMHARIVICGGFAQSGVLILQAVSTSGRHKVSK